MSINVTISNSDDVQLLHIDGIKRADILERMNQRRTRSLIVEFHESKDLQVLQDELNKTLPETIRLVGKFEEPKQEGLYLTSTGLLLCKDTEGDWSIRAYDEGDLYTSSAHCNLLGENDYYETDWLKIIKKLGAKAFPLTRVHVTPVYNDEEN